MVETIMIFALGFLAAALIALLIIPAINARAERLARKRVEALFPLSISELTAEKDHLRAEFAMIQRRIERKAEEAQALKHQSLEELGRRAVRIEALETALAERDRTNSTLDTDLSEARSRMAETAEELLRTQTSLSGIRETLSALENAHRATLDELSSVRGELDRTKATLASVKSELALTQDRLAAQERAYADLDGTHRAALSDLDAKRITISDLETRLMTQTARGDDFERALGERRSELSNERQRLLDLAKDLAAERERGLVLDQKIRELEAERTEKTAEASALAAKLEDVAREKASWQSALDEQKNMRRETEAALAATQARIAALETTSGREGEDHAAKIRTLSQKVEVLKAEKTTLEGALMASREDRARLESELLSMRKNGPGSEVVRAENAELRQRINEVADLVMRESKGKPEGNRRRRSART